MKYLYLWVLFLLLSSKGFFGEGYATNREDLSSLNGYTSFPFLEEEKDPEQDGIVKTSLWEHFEQKQEE